MNNKPGKLILVRHGRSEWNTKGLWTGWQNPDLDEQGVEEAKKVAEYIKDIPIDIFMQSDLKRVQHTIQIIKDVLQCPKTETITTPILRERKYGIYEGKNKWEIKEQVGEEEFQKIRRGWDHKIPEGETLKDVYNRVVPFYKTEILPRLMGGKTICIGSSGNSLRALVKYLENIPDETIAQLEIRTGEVYIYEINSDGTMMKKEIRGANREKGEI